MAGGAAMDNPGIIPTVMIFVGLAIAVAAYYFEEGYVWGDNNVWR